MKVIYSLFLVFYFLGVRVVSKWNPKANLWLAGRKETKKRIVQTKIRQPIWFHAASLGEFEQISFLIEQVKKKFPSEQILVTFYSPSGYEVRKNFRYADEVMYLPFDFKNDIQSFIDILCPKMVFWVRYEFWLNAIEIINKKKIPIYLLNGVFYPKVSIFYKPILKKALSLFTERYVISEESRLNLFKLGYEGEVLYDTRYDRMKQIVEEPFDDKIIQHFVNHNQVVVCGSIWENDDIVIEKSIRSNDVIRWVLVPHEIKIERINQLRQRFPEAQLYSNYLESNPSNILIVDSMGFLSKIYRFADICYVGGGFNKVVHSLIEPLAYAIPILIGKNIAKSEEAREFLFNKLVLQINNADEFLQEVSKLFSQENIAENKRKHKIFNHRIGSIDKIMFDVQKNLDL